MKQVFCPMHYCGDCKRANRVVEALKPDVKREAVSLDSVERMEQGGRAAEFECQS